MDRRENKEERKKERQMKDEEEEEIGDEEIEQEKKCPGWNAKGKEHDREKKEKKGER